MHFINFNGGFYMYTITARRESEEFSYYKLFIIALLRFFDPDEVVITSTKISTALLAAENELGRVEDILRGKKIKLRVIRSKYVDSLLKGLNNIGCPFELIPQKAETCAINEIYFKKNGHVVALLSGSSVCIERDLNNRKYVKSGNSEYSFDHKTDTIFILSEYVEELIDLCKSNSDFNLKGRVSISPVLIDDAGIDPDHIDGDYNELDRWLSILEVRFDKERDGATITNADI